MRTPTLLLLALMASTLLPAPANAAARPTAPRRPKIGLVLSGGGAKGMAHVGVIKVLEEAGIRADIVTGTSMGAIVGALYAAGYSARELETIVHGQEWNRLLFDRFSRVELRMQDKNNDGRYFLTFFREKGHFVPPSGVSRGQRITALFSRLTWPVHHITNFAALPVPFACVATDVHSGNAVVLAGGSLPLAMRASMAIPSFFIPVELDGRLLVDGGLTMNFPVDLARQMGADIIIGVDVSDNDKSIAELKNISEILYWISMYQNRKILDDQRKRCDILIRPDIGKYRSASFSAAVALTQLGEQAARRQLPALRALAARIPAPALLPSPGTTAGHRFRLSRVTILGGTPAERIQFRRILEIEQGKGITAAAIESRINTLYTSGLYEAITWRLNPCADGRELEITVRKAANQRLRFGLRYDLDTRGAVLVNHTTRGIIGQWSELDLNLEVGRNFIAGGQLFFDARLIPWLQSFLALQYEHWDISIYQNRKITDTFDYNFAFLSLGLQTLNSRHLLFKLAINRELAYIRPNISNNFTSSEFHDFLIFSAGMKLDTLNRADFPERGMLLETTAGLVTPWLSLIPGDLRTPVFRIHGDCRFFVPLAGWLTLCGTLTLGATAGSMVPDDYLFYFGGSRSGRDILFPFPGLHFMEVASRNGAAVTAGLRVEPWRGLFFSLLAGYLRTADALHAVFRAEAAEYQGWGIEAGIRTPIGPVRVALTGNEDWKLVLNLEAGYRF